MRRGQLRFEHDGSVAPQLELRLTRGASVAGRLTDASGDGVGNERVYARSAAEAIADGSTDVLGACLKRQVAPSMVVLADAMDPAWTAAAALAALCALPRPDPHRTAAAAAAAAEGGVRMDTMIMMTEVE